jgi:hypothetical protein
LISWLFLRLLAFIYLAAFASLSVQITGLVEETGILPLSEHFSQATEYYEERTWLWYPSLFWITGSSDLALRSISLLGIVLSLMLLFGRWQRLILIMLFTALSLALSRWTDIHKLSMGYAIVGSGLSGHLFSRGRKPFTDYPIRLVTVSVAFNELKSQSNHQEDSALL